MVGQQQLMAVENATSQSVKNAVIAMDDASLLI